MSLCCAGIGLLVVSQSVVGQLQLDLESGFRLLGGVTLLAASVYAAVRYETEPLVSEYGPTTYLLVTAALVWIAALAARLALTVS